MADFPYQISYGAVLSQVEAYYGQGSPVWNSIVADSSTGFSRANYAYLEQIGISPIVSANGKVLGYYQTAHMPSHSNTIYEVVDSNQQAATYGGNSTAVKVNGTATQTQVEGKTQTTFNSGAKSVSTGTTVATTALNVLWGVGAVALAGKLGKAINDAFYDSGASWAFSEEDWNDFYWRQDGLGKFLLNTLYGVDGENGTMYMDEQMLAQMYMMMVGMGIYGESAKYTCDDSRISNQVPQPLLASSSGSATATYSLKQVDYQWQSTNCLILPYYTNTGIESYVLCKSTSPDFSVRYKVTGNNWSAWTNFKSSRTTGTTYISGTRYYLWPATAASYSASSLGTFVSAPNLNTRLTSSYATDMATIIYDGVNESPVTGVENDPQATTYIDPSLINGQDRATVLQQLKDNYPELFAGSIYQDVPQQDGTNQRITYVPVPMPNLDDQLQPTTGANHQNNPATNPATNTASQLQTIIDLLTKPTDPSDVPDTGGGNTPVVPVPAGTASSLWKIYNPTQAQIDAFGSWLWSSNFVDQIKKLFNDPMQGIIGVHKVFATPSVGGSATIKVGYLDSEVPSAYVDNQYTTVDCGTASLREYFGNVFDYAPYTKVSLYLPFIGIVDLDVGDVMRATIRVKYHVDVLTGACLADVIVNRDGVGGVLYQYAGSAIVTYPVSSGTYLGALAGVAAVATGAVATVMTGGIASSALAVAGTATGLSHLHANVGHSGAFNGCAGAMGGKKPYLIVSRPQTAMAGSYKHFTGLPANAHVTLSDCDGYTRVKSVYVKGIHRASEEEKNMIESQLMAGVLV